MQLLRLFTSIMRNIYFKNDVSDVVVVVDCGLTSHSDVSDTGNENIHRLTQQRQMDVYLKVFTLKNTLC